MNNTASGSIASTSQEASHTSVIVFLIALTIAAISALVWKEHDSLNNVRSQVRSELMLQSLSLSSLLENSFESAEQTLNGVAYRIEYNAGKVGIALDLRRTQLRSPSLTDLRAYDINHALSERAGMSRLNSELLPEWAQDEIAHGRSTGFGKDGDSIAFYRTVRRSDGAVLGTVYATMAGEYFLSQTSQNLLSDVDASYLVGPDDTLMLNLSQQDNTNQLVNALQSVKKLDVEFGGHGSKISEVGDKLIVIQQLRNYPLRIVQITANDVVIERWKGNALYSLGLASLIILAASLFITNLRRAERVNRRLISDLYRMNLVIEQSPVPIVITDLDANIVYVNSAFSHNTGYERDEVIGQNPRRLQSGITEVPTYRDMWHQLVHGCSWHGVLINKRKDGNLFWEESFIAPLRDISGRTTHYFAVKIDVSARHLAEEKLLEAQVHLQASHDLLDHLSRHIPGVIYQYQIYPDGTECVPYASEGANALFGLRPDQVQSDATALFRLVHADDLVRLRNSIAKSAQDLTMWQQEYRVTTGKGEIRWVSGQANPMKLPDGSVLWHGFIRDVSERKILEQTIHDHVRDLNTILDNSSVGISFVRDRRIVWANLRMGELFGYALEEMVGQNTRDFYPSQASFDALGEQYRQAMATGDRYIVEQPMRHKDGRDVWMRVSGKVVDPDNPAVGSIWIFEDITEQRRIFSSLQLAANVFTYAREGIMITDAKGTILAVNETFSTITGYERSEVLGKNPRILNSGRQANEFYVAMWKNLQEKGHWYGEVWNRRKSGEVYAEMQTVSAVKDAQGVIQNYVALFSDISPMKAHERELERIAHYDALTQLPNRVLLADRLQQAMIQSQRRRHCLAVVYLDLDGFKSVNDAFGHPAGDTLLIEISQRIKSALREGDTLARIGGDEFVAILADLENSRECEPVLARMLVAASEPVTVGTNELRVSASMGVTLYPQDDSEADLLMRHADQAMYCAKQAGKHRYHLFDVAQDSAMQARRESIQRVSQALDSGELVLYYQPKVNMRTGHVVGAEALVRWQHPQRGLLASAEFLPLVEDHQIGVAIGEWVIQTALTQMAVWRNAGFAISVSVNVGARQLQQTTFVDRLKQILAAYKGVDPQHLQLEVLESHAFQDVKKVGEIMNRCHAFGVTFALDDFGTGYSSLTYLKQLPARTLKIDQSFVHDMLENPSDLAIVNGVIGLARAFGREVIAEGVESVAHRDMLLSIGCELAQGFGIARPMPASELAEWAANWSRSPAWIK